jgi:hypothetical protein
MHVLPSLEGNSLRVFLHKTPAICKITMFANNDEARAAMFATFGEFQASFSAFIAAYAKEPDKATRSALATAFVKETAIPYMDAAKDGLLAVVIPPMLAIDGDITKLLHVFGGGTE